MATFDASPLSIFSSATVIEHLVCTPAATDAAGDRIPRIYTPAGIIPGHLQDITADEINQLAEGAYHSGDCTITTTADLQIYDRIRVSGEMWEIVACVHQTRMLQPARTRYLIRQITTANQ